MGLWAGVEGKVGQTVRWPDILFEGMAAVFFTLLGFALRLGYLLRVPPFLDEYSSMLTGLSILRTGGIPRLPSGVLYPSGSLFSYLEAAFFGLFGFGDFIARLPSLLCATLTLPLFYIITRRLFNRRAALFGILFLALTPEAVVWGGRARMYALLQLLVLLMVYAFYRAVLDVERRAISPWLWPLLFWASIFAQDEAILLLPVFWAATLIARGLSWFLRWRILLSQVLLPLLGVGVRYWLNEIRVPGEVYTLTHDAFLRFPPSPVHGLVKIAPFFTAPWVWPLGLLFLLGLVWLLYDAVARRPVRPVAFAAWVVLAVAAAIVLVVNDPWQDDRYLFMVLPQLLMVAAWSLDRSLIALGHRRPILGGRRATAVLAVSLTLLLMPGGLSALNRYEPDYSAAYRWVAARLEDDDLIVTVRPAPAAVYLGRCDVLAAEDKHQEFIMRLNGQWIDRWAGAQVIESPEAFRDRVLKSGRTVWFVIDEDRFESVAYSPEFVALILEQMELVYREGGVLVFRGQGYTPPPEMTVVSSLNADFAGQLLLTGYGLSTDRPRPGEEVTLQLYWQAVRPERNYTVFVHLVGADGRGLTQVDGQPFLGLYSMSTHWPHDRPVTDTRHLTIPADTLPGRYRLEVGLYDADDLEAGPLPLLDAEGNAIGDRLTLDFLKVNVAPPPPPVRRLDEGTLGGLVRLQGYDPALPLQIAAGGTLPLTLTWECVAPITENYTVFVHLLAKEGTPPLAQADGPPLGGFYPTAFWDVGERLTDPHSLSLPDDLPPGAYELRVGLYLLASGERLPLLDEKGQVKGDSILLGYVEVSAP